MEENNIRDIWREEYGKADHKPAYTPEDIQAFKLKQSSRAFRSGKQVILFDIGFKGLLIMALGYLWFLSQTSGDRLITGMLILLTLVLMLWEGSFLKKLPSAHLDRPVVIHLKEHLNYLKTTYSFFVLLSAYSSLLFVITGFLFNFYFKYDELFPAAPWEDPVIYGFLVAAFMLSFVAQKVTQQMQIHEIRESIAIIEGTDPTEEMMVQIRKRKRRNIIVGTLLVLLGMLFLFLILFK